MGRAGSCFFNIILSALGVSVMLCSPVTATIHVQTPKVGFPCADSPVRAYRNGAFCPVALDIRLTEGEPRGVFLRVEQYDRDGDVVYSERFATLTPNPDGGVRMQWLYYVPNPDLSARAKGLEFQILDAETREAIEFVHDKETTRRLEVVETGSKIPEKHFYMLIISEDGSGPLIDLGRTNSAEGPRFNRPLELGNISVDEIPDHWHGLEMVDAIVWDAATPTVLSADQIDALLDWVERGGHLLVTGSTTADNILQKDGFGSVIPATRTGNETVSGIPNRLYRGVWDRVGRELVEEDDQIVDVGEDISVALCTVSDPDARRIARVGSDRVYGVSTAHKLGRVSFLAVTLRDMLAGQDEEDCADFVRNIFALQRYSGDHGGLQHNEVPMFNALTAPIAFSGRTAVYVFMVILFVAIYAVGATWGTWAVLNRQGRLTYCWPVFAVTAGAASFVSYGAVRAMQGVGYDLHQMTIVDTESGTYSATATAFFGIKTSSMANYDFWLPSADQDTDEPQWTSGYLRSLSPLFGPQFNDKRFADTKSYRSRSAFAELVDVPIRATLRQLEGYWHGTMGGQITATINAGSTLQGENVVGPDSLMVNGMDHDLENVFLIESRLDIHHAATRAHASYVYELGPLAAGEALDLEAAIAVATDNKNRYELGKFQSQSAGRLGGWSTDRTGLSQLERVVMLVTTMREFEPEARTYNTIDLMVDNCRWLDRSLAIDRHQYMLVCFARHPGPVELYGREGDDPYEPLKPRSEMCTTVYRLTVPVQ